MNGQKMKTTCKRYTEYSDGYVEVQFYSICDLFLEFRQIQKLYLLCSFQSTGKSVNQISLDSFKIGIEIKLCLFTELLGSPSCQSTATTNFRGKKGKKKGKKLMSWKAGETPKSLRARKNLHDTGNS